MGRPEMKRLIIITMFVLIVPGQVRATETETLAWTLAGLHLIDWMQTRRAVEEGREVNFLIGQNRTRLGVDLYIGLYSLAVASLLYNAPPKSQRRGFLVLIGMKGFAVGYNWSVGFHP